MSEPISSPSKSSTLTSLRNSQKGASLVGGHYGAWRADAVVVCHLAAEDGSSRRWEEAHDSGRGNEVIRTRVVAELWG